MKNSMPEYVIIGLGKTGDSAIEFIAKNISTSIGVIDENPNIVETIKSKYSFLKFVSNEIKLDWIRNAKRVIVSPGVNCSRPIFSEVKHRLESDISLFLDYCQAPVIGVTGTNGKSTVVNLISAILECAGINVAVGGNIGIPCLNNINKNVDYHVLELSSFQLDICSNIRTFIAVLLNISPNHLDRYGNFDSYVKSKHTIFTNTQLGIFNVNDRLTVPNNKLLPQYGFGSDDVNYSNVSITEKNGKMFFAYKGDEFISNDDFNLLGKHNAYNVLVAIEVALKLNVSIEHIVAAVKNFKGLPHRCQVVKKENEVMWINDSKSTNISSTYASATGISLRKKNIHLILGGIAKSGSFKKLIPALKYVHKIYVYGEAMEIIYRELSTEIDILRISSLQAAVIAIDKFTKPGDVVLFSPACSSFDMFDNFEHRGKMFEKMVNNLK